MPIEKKRHNRKTLTEWDEKVRYHNSYKVKNEYFKQKKMNKWYDDLKKIDSHYRNILQKLDNEEKKRLKEIERMEKEENKIKDMMNNEKKKARALVRKTNKLARQNITPRR